MSTKKIKWRESNSIAGDIAAKAFEHLLDPLEKDMTRWVQDVFDRTIENLGLSGLHRGALIEAEILKMHAYCTVEFTVERNDNGWLLGKRPYFYRDIPEGESLPNIYPVPMIKIVDPTLAVEFERRKDEMAPLEAKKRALRETIHNQIEGRTCNYVMKEWPEAASFVVKHCDLNVTPIFKPLENLLARFLPALPAPTGA